MKSIKKILFLLFICTFISFAHIPTTPQRISADDSLKVKLDIDPLTEIQIKFDEFELHREFNNMKMDVQIDGDPQTVWLRTSLALSNTENSGRIFLAFFLSPLEKNT